MQGKKSLGNIDEECGMSVTSSSTMILKTLFSKQCATKGAKENKRESAIEHVLWWIFFCYRLCCGFLQYIEEEKMSNLTRQQVDYI